MLQHPRPNLPFLPLPALEEKGTALVADELTEPLLSPSSPRGRTVTFFSERKSASLDQANNPPYNGNNDVVGTEDHPVNAEESYNGLDGPIGNGDGANEPEAGHDNES